MNNQTPPPPVAHDVNPSQSAPTETQPQKPKKHIPWLKVLVFGIVALVTIAAFGLIAYLYMGNQNESQLVNDNSSMVNETPTPTPDPTADWSEYSNSKYGYTIKYPESWEPQRGPGNLTDEELKSVDQFDLYDPNLPNGDPGTGLNITVSNSTSCSDLDDCYSKSFKWLTDSRTINTTDVTFLGVPAKMFSYNLENQLYSQSWKYIFFIYDENAYSLYLGTNIERQESDFELFNQILSTFKFTDASEASSANTSDWKTYTNNDYKYSILYPDTIEEFESDWEYLEFKDDNEKANSVGFRPKEVREDVLWGINVYENESVEKVIADIGDQFSDRNEKRENININGIDAILVSVTTNEVPTWTAKNIIITDGNRILSISNGARDDLEFENFYKSFKFTE